MTTPIDRMKLWLLDQTGATSGQVPRWNSTSGRFEPSDTLASAGDNITIDNTDPAHPVISARVVEPLTTEINGVPDLVWDDDNRLVMTEAHV